MGCLFGLLIAFFGGSLAYNGIRILTSSTCAIVQFSFGGGHIVKQTCYAAGASIPNGWSAGWAGIICILVGGFILLFGLGFAGAGASRMG